MPDEKKDDPLPAPVGDNAKEDKAKLPVTAEERRVAHFKLIEGESDGTRSNRRAKDYKLHVDTHTEHLREAHAKYPAPFLTKAQNWETLSDVDKLAWNERRKQIDSANRAYHLAVRATFSAHRAEDAHLARVRATKEVA